MRKILIGGSPCTHWSIAQKNNRETEPAGEGWELFLNYLIVKEKFKPDFFLYENNKSASPAIKNQISKELNTDLMYINSALVSAQNRERFYAFNAGTDVPMPEDRGILLYDILESGVVDREKNYCLKHQASNARDYFKKHHTQIVFIPANTTPDGKSKTIKAQYQKTSIANICCYTSTYGATMVAEPIRVGSLPRPNGELSQSQGFRIYDISGKSVGLKGNSGGAGGKTGLYAIPIEYAKPCEWDDNGRPTKAISETDDKIYTVYAVKNGIITIKCKEYPIKLSDGFYIIRKLTPIECERLQTLPDNYTEGISNTQRYKCLGNGWTAEVIIHILQHLLKDIPRDEKLIVLSMYDGIATGRYCLDKMGFNNVEYHAYEIDKYAIKVAENCYPDIIQCGNAFQVRNTEWKIN